MRIEWITVVLAAGLATGCAAPDPSPAGPRPGADTGPARPAYTLYRAEAVGLVDVVDDGRATYLAFAEPPPDALALFDQDGRPLARVTAGRVTAVDGLYGGLLVRDGERAGFVAPDATAAPVARPWPPGPDHQRVRVLLDRGGPLMLAMQRALAGARLNGAGAGGPAPAAPAGAPPAVAAIDPVPVPPAAVSLPPPTQPAAPLAIANAVSAQAELGLLRVFFASASRTIVAPEDGLALLLRNAPLADEIRVTGFTDAAGSLAGNETMARARADAILRILVRQGIPSERISLRAVAAAGYLADNGSDRGRALNRRAEIELRRQGAPLVLR